MDVRFERVREAAAAADELLRLYLVSQSTGKLCLVSLKPANFSTGAYVAQQAAAAAAP
jgi:hypothetical protein